MTDEKSDDDSYEHASDALISLHSCLHAIVRHCVPGIGYAHVDERGHSIGSVDQDDCGNNNHDKGVNQTRIPMDVRLV